MRVLVTASHVPFVRGGAEAHMQQLTSALRQAGHEVELMRLPFRFWPEEAVEAAMDYCADFDLTQLSGPPADRVISLQFPSYGMRHPNHVVWLMHQHRAVYELYGTVVPATPRLEALRGRVMAFDCAALGAARRVFANSARVAERLQHFNGLRATPLYHPPPGHEALFCSEDWGYVFFPSRLERLKRQWLLLDAARLVRSPVKFVLTGEGGQREALQAMVARHGLGDRVFLRGHVSRREQLAWYAHAMAVFFGPHDEDLGYVTLEAMCAAKPVITCTDSGAPLEFVRHEETGLVCAPEPEAIAEAVERLWARRTWAAELGRHGRMAFEAAGISWSAVVQHLLAET